MPKKNEDPNGVRGPIWTDAGDPPTEDILEVPDPDDTEE